MRFVGHGARTFFDLFCFAIILICIQNLKLKDQWRSTKKRHRFLYLVATAPFLYVVADRFGGSNRLISWLSWGAVLAICIWLYDKPFQSGSLESKVEVSEELQGFCFLRSEFLWLVPLWTITVMLVVVTMHWIGGGMLLMDFQYL